LNHITEAIKVASRSTIRTHKTGCIIVDRPHYRLRSKRSLHAEIHALARARYINLFGATAYVATISGKSGNIVNAKPCLDCAIALQSAGVTVVWFTLPNGDGNWLNLNDPATFDDLKVYVANGN
jgi:deoxycytidylate deaminase